MAKYLFGRGIDYQLIQECIAEGIIFESADYHNAVFIGKDESGTPKYAACRGTISSFKRDASGSDKRYSFRLLAREPCASVHLFEAAIDLLSYATYLKCEGKDYKAENLLSLSGVYQPKKEIKDSKIPVALTTFLKANPQIKTIFLHLDKDRAGRLCTAALKELLQKDYRIVDEPPPVGKDFNDFLMSYLGIARQKQSRERGDARWLLDDFFWLKEPEIKEELTKKERDLPLKQYEVTLTGHFEKTVSIYADSPEQAAEKLKIILFDTDLIAFSNEAFSYLL